MTTSRADERVLRRLNILSSEGDSPQRYRVVQSYLKRLFPTVKVTLRPSLFCGIKEDDLEDVANRLASARMKDPSKEVQTFEPMYGEIDYELRSILGRAKVGGIVYDGRKLMDLSVRLLGESLTDDTATIVFTNRLVSTYSHDDMRHHLRTVVFGFPNIISIPGIVEAPAKPREYYLMKQRMEMEGASELALEELKSGFKGRFVDYDDPAVIEVAKGLSLQAVVYHLTLRPFCQKKDCRLFNAHWQEDLIRSQVQGGGLCSSHTRLIKQLGNRPALAW